MQGVRPERSLYEPKRSFSPALLLCLPALAGAGGLAWALSTYGPSMAQTGLHNVAAAESLLSGAPLETSRGELFTLWPPLMPLAFAAGARAGLEFADVALAGNVLACFVLLFGVGYLVWMASASLLASLLAQVFLMAVPPLFRSMVTIQTEPWFLALVVAGALTAVLHLETRRSSWLIASACCLALAALQRYVGAVFCVLTALFLVSAGDDRPLGARLRRSALFLGASILPLFVWMVRNYLGVGHPTGPRDESYTGYTENTLRALETVRGWFVPASWPDLLASLLLASLAVGALAAVVSRRRAALLAALLAAVYPPFMVIYGSNAHLDPLGSRLMLPCLPFLAVLVAGGFGWLVRCPTGRARLAGRVGLVALGVVAAFGLRPTAARALTCHQGELGGIESRQWSESELVGQLAELDLSPPVYSNLPELVTYYAGVPAEPLPAKGLKRTIKSSRLMVEPGFIVWLAPGGTPPFRAGQALELTLLVECPEGAVYRTRPAPR